MAYFTKEDVKELIGKTGTDDDTFIDKLILQVTDEVNNRTGRLFEVASTAARFFDAIENVDGRLLLFNTWAADDPTLVTNGDGVVVAEDDYKLYGDGRNNAVPFHSLELKSDSGLSWVFTEDKEEAIEVKAKWAYSETPPLDLKGAMVRLCAYYLRTRKEKQDALPVWVYKTIDRYAAPFQIVS